MTKIGTKSLKTEQNQKQRLKPVEDAFYLESFFRIEEEGIPIGATILKKQKKESYRLVFGFDCEGISPLQSEEQFVGILTGLESGLKDLPPGEFLTVHLGSFVDDTQRQQELGEVSHQTTLPELKLLVTAERQRVRELTEQGVRKQKFLRLYCTYTVEEGGEKPADFVEGFLMKGVRWWQLFTGEYDTARRQQIEQFLLTAYRDGYHRWQQLLANQMGLAIRPLSEAELWASLWHRFNNSAPRPLPQRIVFDGETFKEEINSSIHPLSLLMETEESIPQSDRRFIKINHRYTGVLLFADKPDGWADEGEQLRYLWEVMSRESVWDTEIICQLQRGNDRIIKEKMHSLTKQAKVASEQAEEKNDVDVGAALRVRKTLEAQESLYEGDIPVYMGVVALLHRNSPRELDNACSYFMSCFQRQGWVIRETEYPWRIWLETFPLLCWDKLLTKPFQRRQTYLSSEAPGLMPLVKTPQIETTGFELIAVEGGTPVCVNLYDRHRHLGIFATTRSGKSVLASGILTQGLARNIPVTAMDFPRADGTGTFNDLCEFLSGCSSYFDIGNSGHGCNLFEPPNLRGLSPKLQQERLLDFQDFLLEILMFMVMGIDQSNRGEINPDTIRSLLQLALRTFYEDFQIKERYAAAFREGFGTLPWREMPVLSDFIPFCSQERLRLTDADSGTIKALRYIKLRLVSWQESRIGMALSKPTTFPTDNLMLVTALRNLGNDTDAAVLAMLSNLVAIRRSLAFPVSIVFVDEAPILFEYDAIANFLGSVAANGAKSGIRLILNAQEPGTIARSGGGEKILANLTTRIIGRIQPGAIDAYEKWLNYPRGLIQENATTRFMPNKLALYSQWLLDDNGTYIPVRHYPSLPLLSVVANNPEESQLRQQYFEQCSDKVQGLVAFSQVYKTQLMAA